MKWRWYAVLGPAVIVMGMALLVAAMYKVATTRHMSRSTDDLVRFTIIASVLIQVLGMLWMAWGLPFFRSGDAAVPFKRVPESVNRSMRVIVWLPAAFIFAVSFVVPGYMHIQFWRTWGEWDTLGMREQAPGYAIMLTISIVFIVIAHRLTRAVESRLINKSRALNICYACGYDMRGNPDGPCPECGYENDTPST